jgi:hypothetical protein
MSAGKKYVVNGRPPTSTSTVSPFLTNSTESAARHVAEAIRSPTIKAAQSWNLL